MQKETGRKGTIGVGIPGAMSTHSELVKNANSTWIIGKPLGRDLERALGQPVRLSNDANCFVLSEATDGAAKGARTVFGVILGTGTGGGIVDRRTRARRPSSDCRRVGTQSVTLALGRRVTRTRVLLRPSWMHRNVSLGPRPRPNLCRLERRFAGLEMRPALLPEPKREMRTHRGPSTSTKAGSPGRWQA